MMGLSDNAKIGILLIALGFLFLSLGVLLFFDAGLMAIGASRRARGGQVASVFSFFMLPSVSKHGS